MPKAKTKTKKKKVRKEIGFGIAHIQSTFNNTIITIADHNGNTVCWASAGTSGFKGARKGTPFAAQLAAKDVAVKAKEFGRPPCGCPDHRARGGTRVLHPCPPGCRVGD